MKTQTKLAIIIVPVLSILFLGWGSVGHRIINGRTILSVTSQMSFWGAWSDSLAAHGSDADIRKSTDPTEAPKHYIDIDNYPEFNSTGRISQDFDSLVALHGYSFVMDQGILPWAVMTSMDSIQSAFEQNNYHKAMLISADLGHYIGDMHMPLHLTRNYNGQYTGQTGVHSRYESTMINTYNAQITYTGDSLFYIDNIPDFVFDMVYENYMYVDSVLKCDSIAKAFAGSTTSSVYYSKLWELTKGFTIRLFRNASYKLTSLIYTAWINAGNPTVVDENYFQSPTDFQLAQNYPNPFNPSTKIRWQSPVSSHQSLKVFDVLGNEVATLVDEYREAGNYEADLNGSVLSSGIYFYQLTAGNPSSSSGQGFVETKKMILMK